MARHPALRDFSRDSQMREPFLSQRHRNFFAAVLELTYAVRA